MYVPSKGSSAIQRLAPVETQNDTDRDACSACRLDLNTVTDALPLTPHSFCLNAGLLTSWRRCLRSRGRAKSGIRMTSECDVTPGRCATSAGSSPQPYRLRSALELAGFRAIVGWKLVWRMEFWFGFSLNIWPFSATRSYLEQF